VLEIPIPAPQTPVHVRHDRGQAPPLQHLAVHREGLAGPDQKLPTAVHIKHGVNRAGKAIHYYFNFSGVPQSAAYAYARGKELLANRAVAAASALALEPWGVAIVEEE